MGLEEEINQKRFFSIQQKAHLNVMFTSNWIIDQIKVALKPFDITHQQFNVLRILKGKYPENCAVSDIKEVMIDKSPDLTRLLDRLIDKNLIQRTVCEENRRKMDIVITSRGLDLIEKIEPFMKKQFVAQMRITNEEGEELNRILDKIRG